MSKKSASSSKPLATRNRLLLLLLTSLLTGCVTLIDKPSSVEWNTCYQPIDSPEARAFLEQGIALLIETHGQPAIPINEVLLRCSEKTDAASAYDISENFSLTEIVDAERGLLCIYVGVPPTHKKFYYLLAHEIGHLLRPTIIDSAEEERFCNEFSRQLCEQQSRPWSAKWETRRWVNK